MRPLDFAHTAATSLWSRTVSLLSAMPRCPSTMACVTSFRSSIASHCEESQPSRSPQTLPQCVWQSTIMHAPLGSAFQSSRRTNRDTSLARSVPAREVSRFVRRDDWKADPRGACMIVDCHTHWGSVWGDRDGCDSSQWLAILDRNEVTHAIVLGHRGIADKSETVRDHNDVAAVCAKSSGRMIQFLTVHPSQGRKAVDEAVRCIDKLGARGMKFH